jgi:hypothetical protein
VVSSTTKVDNLNADLLDGADWASPAAIGFTTPAPGKFTSLEPQGNLTKYAWDLQVSTNDAALVHGQNSEEITLSTSGTTTDSVAILLPGNSIIDGVVARVTQAITLATDWSLGDSAQPNRFTIAQTGSQLGLGGTAVGLNHKDPTVASQALGPVQLNDGRVRVTTTGTPGQGKLRVTVFYRNFVAPQS